MSIKLKIDGATGRLIIDRALKRNAMTTAMFDALPALIAEAVADPAVRVLTVQSARSGIFCAGADIAELAANAHDAAWQKWNQNAINRAQHDLARAAKPVIAMIDGDCIGAGCGLALACDLRIATSRARFGITPAKLGLVYPFHDTKLLVDLVGPGQAKRLLFGGELIDAAEAHRIGLIETIADDADEILETLCANSRHSLIGAKAMIRRALDGQIVDDETTLGLFAQSFAGGDFAEGVAAFLGKRAARFG